MKNKRIKRIFLVGCPRSGTTLLQSLLIANPEILSFPESHFFVYLNKQRKNIHHSLGLASKQARMRFDQFLSEIEHDEMQHYLPKMALFLPQYVTAFIKVLDTLTEKQNKSLWIEKTPDHVFYIDQIEKLVPQAKFIHILRKGEDVVASLYEVTHKYPKVWNGAWDIDRCVQKWITSVNTSLKNSHKPNHILVNYEQLIADPNKIIANLSDFIDVPFSELKIEERKGIVHQIVLKDEPWKVSVSDPIRNANGSKFYELFDESQRRHILDSISSVDIKII